MQRVPRQRACMASAAGWVTRNSRDSARARVGRTTQTQCPPTWVWASLCFAAATCIPAHTPSPLVTSGHVWSPVAQCTIQPDPVMKRCSDAPHARKKKASLEPARAPEAEQCPKLLTGGQCSEVHSTLKCVRVSTPSRVLQPRHPDGAL